MLPYYIHANTGVYFCGKRSRHYGQLCQFLYTFADLLYQDEIHGSLIEQIDQLMEVLHLKYMKAKITYDGMQRIERYFVPDEALREALLNALCHKQYESGIPIQISVYEDRGIMFIAHRNKVI